MLYRLDNDQVQYDPSCFIAPTASVIGKVFLAANSSVWFNVVIRGDSDVITIGANSNIQDNSVVHTDAGIEVIIGRNVTIGHGCIIHGCQIGDNSLIGMGSTLLNEVKIGKNCIIGANSLITQRTQIPDNSLVIGSPAKVIRPVSEDDILRNRQNAQIYVDRGQQYLTQLQPQTR